MSKTVCTVGIYTLGCKVNQYESEAIAELFEENGFLLASPSALCDVYVINTCTVTAESDRKARQFIRRAIHNNPNAYILVTGCLAQTAPQQIAQIDGVDFICGNHQKLAVVNAAMELCHTGKKNLVPTILHDKPDVNGFEQMRISRFDRTRAYIKIEDGCESKCAYCIIPAARGSIRSKPLEEVVEEVSALTRNGCHEVVLTGIETASWGKDLENADLSTLLKRVNEIPGIGRVRLGSLDPSLIKQDFVDAIAPLHALAPHFHLSMQSGSDKILARMRRKYNTKMALDGMERLRQAIPGVQFTTDMIVGFPGETEEDFKETLMFIKKAGFLMVHVFPYSKREGTVAAAMPEQVPQEIKHQRVAILLEAASCVRQELLKKRIGRTEEVLFETDKNGIAYGHTASFVEVACPSPCPLQGQILPVRINGADRDRCQGELA